MTPPPPTTETNTDNDNATDLHPHPHPEWTRVADALFSCSSSKKVSTSTSIC
eukprot:CAMPEP_0170839278 /NCGR_PEP_ID=MMETSP0734-20130129/3896_1 /TAXON_ID=186038 /ORGANISM="Fragilariopsis kerguelensis, Strain L26-C5" /LENGTH=51 /DNA_ID=CAMNT_0011206883 /DNA_START=754 /DNA_END=906 /DNA_ORIENTATION=-